MEKALVTRLLATTASIAWLAVTAPVHAQTPQAPTVAAGSIAITRQGATTVVNQTTDRGIIDWRSFSIGVGETVRFDQPGRSSVTLNRVTGPELSRIDGNLSANGQVWLANPNGVLIGNSGQVNVGGLLATTGRIDAAEFLKSGRAAIDQIGKESGIANFGTVNIAEGGYAALAAASIRNEGIVAARKGSVALGAGKAVTVDFTGDKLITFQVTKPLDQAVSGDSMISVGGKIAADGGTVLMSARAAKGVMDNVVNLKGHVIANSVTVDGGTVSFGDGGVVQVSGKIDASNAAGQGGAVTILGEKVGLMDGASVDASGALGGGTVLVGGDWQGKGPSHNATIAYVAPTASINVDATMAGDGGKAVVWADDTTRFNGAISARGGVLAGNGGQVETSGKRVLSVDPAAKVDSAARAAGARAGSWLLDPTDITIDAVGGGVLTGYPDTLFAPAVSSGVSALTLSLGLVYGNVTIQTSAGSGGNGDITFSGGTISHIGLTPRTLTLKADRDININGGAITLSGGKHNVVLQSAAGATSQAKVDGNIGLNGATITTTGGLISFVAGATGALTPQSILNLNGVLITNGSVVSAGTGSISISGATSASKAGTNGVRIDGKSVLSASGGININGFGNDSASYGGNGVYINNGTVSATGGAVTITGDRRAGSGVNIYLDDKALISNSGGPITLNATSTTGASVSPYGVYTTSGSTISTVDGLITIQGNAATAGITDTDGVGIGGTIKATGTGAINITGARGGHVTGQPGFSENIVILGTGVLQTKTGSITLTGKSGAGGGPNAVGVLVATGGQIITSGGDVTISGVGATAGGGSAHGVSIQGTVTTAGAGVIALDGARGGVGDNVNFSSGILSTTNGAITISALSTVGSGAGVAISGTGGSISTVDGAITILARGGATAGNGFSSDGKSPVKATGTGSVTIEASASASGASGISGSSFSGFIAIAQTNSGDLTLRTDKFAWGGVFAGALSSTSGTVKFQALDATKVIGVGIASGVDLNVFESLLATVNGKAEVGRADLSTELQVASGVSVPVNLTLRTGSGGINFLGAVNASKAGAQSIAAITKSGTVTFNGAVGGTKAFSTIDVQGPTRFNGGWPVISTGSQSYGGAVVVGATGSFTTTNSNIFFGSTVDGSGGLGSMAFDLGAGTASFAGAVGATTSAFNNLSFGNAAFAGDVVTVNAQSYNGVVTLTGLNTTLSAQNSAVTFASGSSISYVNAAAGSLSILSAGDIQFINGAIKSSSAALKLTLNSGANATTQATVAGGIKLDGTTISTLGGDIALVGGKGGTLAASGTSAIDGWGVRAVNSAIDAGAGSFVARGAGGLGVASFYTQGFELFDSKLTANGGVTIVGTGGNAGLYQWRGVNLLGSAINVASGAVSITGTGGSRAGAGDITAATGVHILNTTLSLGSGVVSITGTAGNNVTSAQNSGVLIESASVLTGSGAMTITGTGGGASGSSSNHGVIVKSSSVGVSGAGTLTINGTRGAAASSTNVTLDKGTLTTTSGAISILGTATLGGVGNDSSGVISTNSSVVSTVDGLITIHGAGAANGTLNVDGAVLMKSTITATGAGAINITGSRGAPSGTGEVAENLFVGSGTLIQTTTGSITLTGTSAGGGGINAVGVLAEAGSSVKTSGGNITISGTGASAGGADSNGVLIDGTISTTGAGKISITGVRGGGATSHNIRLNNTAALIKTETGALTLDASSKLLGGADSMGMLQTGAIETKDGAIKITATGSDAGGGDPNGFRLDSGSIKATGSGSITIVGARGATSTGAENIDLNSSTTISATTGSVFLDGSATIGGATSGAGVFVRDSAQVAASAGAITIKGYSAGTRGVRLNNGSTIKASGAGSITIEGATTAATEDMQVSGEISSAGGAITLKANSYVTTSGAKINAGLGSVALRPLTSASPLNLDATLLGYVTAASLEVGQSDMTGAISIPTGTALKINTTFLTNSGAINFLGAVDAAGSGGASLKVNTTSGLVSFAGSVGGSTALASLDVSGAAIFAGATVRTTGAQSYGGAAVLAGPGATTFSTTNAAVTFGSTLNGAGALDVKTGTGVLNLLGAVGGTTLLGGITTSGALTLGAGLTTTGSQSYGGAVTITGLNSTLSSTKGAITLGPSSVLSYTNAGAGSLSLLAATDILINKGSIKSSGAALTLTLNSGATALAYADVAGGIKITAGTIDTKGGSITMVGGAGGALDAVGSAALDGKGIMIEAGSTIDAGAGAILARGRGRIGYAGDYTHGIELINNVTMTANGGVTLIGQGGDSGVLEWRGVNLLSSTINVSGGNTVIAGTGGVKVGSYVGAAARAVGVMFQGMTMNLGSGAVSITGLGGTASDANGSSGILIRSASALNGSGAMTITGTGGGIVSSANNHGVAVQGSSITLSGGGSLKINGARGSGGSSHNISMDGAAVVSSANGSIDLIGSATSGGGVAGGGEGVNMLGSLTTKEGAIFVHGVGALLGASNNGVTVAGTIQATGAGSILIKGGAGLLGSEYTQTAGLVSTNSGDLTLQANSTAVSGPAALTTKSGTIRLQPFTSVESLLVGPGFFSALSGVVEVGKADMTGSISVLAGVTFNNNASFVTKGGAITFQGALDAKAAGQTLKIDGGTGLASFGGAVGGTTAFASLDVSGPLATSASLFRTTGTQSYGGGVAIASGATTSFSTTNAAVTFAGAVNGPGSFDAKTGTGALSFGGAVGATTPLGGFSASGALTLGAGLTTIGAQSYGGAVTLGALNTVLSSTGSSITLGSGSVLSYTNVGAGSLSLLAGTDIKIASGAIKSSSGALNVTLNAGATGVDQTSVGGGIDINAGVIETKGGSLSMVGGAGGAFSAMGSAGIGGRGIYVIGASKFDLGAGSFTAKGIGRNGVAGTYVEGVVLFGGTTVTANGGVTLEGTSGDGATIEGRGVRINTATINSTGAVSIIGKGGGSTVVSRGVDLLDSSLTFGTGGVTITGSGGTNSAQSKNYGVLISGTTALTGSGAITINGTGGGKAGATTNDHGVYMLTGTVSASGAGTVSVTGARGFGGASRNVLIDTGAIVQTVSGALSLKGDSTAGNAGTNNQGVQIAGKVTTATGAISISGAGASAAAGDGVDVSGTIAATGTGGSILLRGVGAGGWSDFVQQTGGAISTTTGDVTIQGGFFNVVGSGNISSGTGTIRLQSLNAADAIDVGVAPGAKGLTTAFLTTLKSAVEIGSASQTGAISVAANTVLNTATTITSGSGAVTFLGAVDGSKALTVNAAGAKTSFAGAVGGTTAFASLDVAGPVSFGDVTVKTSGTQSYGGAAILSGSGTASFSTTNAALTFGSTLDGPGALNVNTGTGALKFVGAVGGATLLGGFSTSGALTLGAGLTTSGAQSYGGLLTLTGKNTLLSSTLSSITLGTGAVLSYTNGAAGSLSLLAGTDVKIAGGTIASSGAALTVTLNAGSTGVDQASVGGGIEISAGTITTNGGALTMVGGVGGAFAAMGSAGIGGRGISVTGATKIDLGAGALTAKGVGRNGVVGSYVEGVALAGGVITANGGVTLEGKSGDGATGIGNRGVWINNTTLTVATGNVAITGDGGGAKVSTSGVLLGTGSILNLGSGATTITGFGAASSAQDSNHGVTLAGAALTTSGALTINGTGGATGIGSSKASAGVAMTGGSVAATGAGTVTVNGQRGLGADSVNILLSTGMISTESGALTLNGASSSGGADSSALLFSSSGVVVNGPATVKTVDGLISVNGAGAAVDGQGADGLRISGKIQATGTGSISLTGARGGATAVGTPTGNDNIEIKSGALVSTNSGAITVTATATEAGGGGDQAMGFRNAGVVTSTSGNLSITGVGAALGTTAHGVDNSGTITTSLTGAITIAGAAGATGFAINTSLGSKVTTAGGQLTLKGQSYFGSGALTATGGVFARQALSPSQSLSVSAGVGGDLAFVSAASVVIGEAGMTGDITVAAGGNLKTNTTFITQSGAINFLGALDGETSGAQSLKIQTVSGVTSFGGSLGAAKAFSVIDVSGPVVSGAALIRTTGTQSYGGAAQIAGGVTTTFSTNNAAVTFGSTLDGPGAFDAKTGTGALKFTGALGGATALAAFSASSAFTLAAGLTTVGDQSYGGVVTLTGTNTTLSSTGGAIAVGTGGVLSYANGLAGSLSLLAKTDVLIDGGAIKSAGAALNLTLNAGAAGTTQATVDGGVLVNKATISTAGGAISMVGGQNGALAAMGGVSFPDFGLSVRNGVMLAASSIDAGAGAILVRGTARDSGFNYGHGVEVNNATLTGLGGVTITGHGSGAALAEANGINLIAGAKLSGGAGGVTLTGTGGVGAGVVSGVVVNNSIVSASGLGVVTVTGVRGTGGGAGYGLSMSAGSLSTAGGALTIKAAEQAVGGASTIAAGAGAVALQSSSTATSLTVSAGFLSFVNAAALTIGESGQTAAINIAAGAVAKQDLTVLSGAGAINFLGAIDATTAGVQSLKVQTASGVTSFGGSVGAGTAFKTLTVTGPLTSSAAVIQTTGTQSYGGAVQITAGVTTKFSTTDSAVTFGSTLEGPGGFDAKTGSGALQFTGSLGGATALGAFSSSGPLTLSGGLTTVGDQSYGGVVTLTGTNGTFSSTGGAIKIGTGGVLSYTNGAAGSLSLLAKADIVIDGGAIKSTSGALTLTLNSGAYATNQADVKGGVLINAGTIATAGGSLLIVGGAGGTLAASGSDALSDLGTGARNGVMLFGGTLVDLGAGAFTARGRSTSTLNYGHGIGVAGSKVIALGGVDLVGAGSNAATLQGFGVRIQDKADLNGGAGGIKINGQGGALSSGAAIGVAIFDSTLSAAGGGLTLSGTGGVGAGDASGVTLNNAALAASGTGAIEVTGVKGTGPGSGLSMAAGSLSTAGGALTIKAAEQAVSGASKIDAGAGTVALQSSSTTTALTVSKDFLSLVNAAALTIGESGQTAAINIAAGATVKQNLTVLSGAGDVNFQGATDANAPGVQSLTIQTSGGSISFAGSVGATKAFNTINASGPVTSKAAEIKTTGTQSYGGAVQIAAGAATTFTTNNAAVGFGGAVNGPGGLAFKVGTATVSLAGGAGSSVALDSLSIGNAALGGTIATIGAQSYGAVTLLSATTLSTGSSGAVTFGGAVAGPNDLTINTSGGAVAFNAGAGALKSLTQLGGGVVTLGGDVTTSLAQFYTGAVNLTTNVTLTSGAFINFLDKVNSAGAPAALTLNATGNVAFNAGAGATTALASLTLLGGGTSTMGGQFKTTGAQSYSGAVTLTGDATFSTNGAGLIFAGAVDSGAGKSMTVLSGTGGVTLAGGAGLSGGPLGSVTIAAPLSVSGGVKTIGAQSYGAVTLASAATFSTTTAASVSFGGAVTGGKDLTIDNGGGAVTLSAGSGAGTLASLTLLGGGAVTLGGEIATTGGQSYSGAVNLANSMTLSSTTGSISFANAVNGATTTVALTLDAAGGVGLNAGAGATTALASLTLLGGGASSLGGLFKTTGAQSYTGAISLTGDATFSTAGAGLTFTGAVNSSAGKSMTVLAGAGGVTLAGGAGLSGGALASVNIAAPLSVSGGVTTTGAQNYGGAITLIGNSAFKATDSGQSIAFGGNVTGPYDLSVSAASIQLGGAAPITVQTTGFANQSYAGAIVLLSDASLEAGNKLTLTATIDGAKALTAKGADVNLAAKIGGSTALASLAAVTTAGPIFIGADIVTSGSQSYSGVVGLSNDVLLKSNGSDVTLSGAVVYGGPPKSLAITVSDPNGKISLGGVVGSAGALNKVTLSTNGTDLLLPTVNAATFTASTKGAVSQAVGSSLSVSGSAVIDAAAGITIANANNDFGAIALTTGGAATMSDVNGFVLSNAAVSGALTLNAGGAVTQTGSLSADGLLLQGLGASFTLNDPANKISTLAAKVGGGSIAVVNGDGASLSVGAVAGVSGVTGAGSLSIDQKGAANTLTLAAPVALGAGAGSLSADGVITGVEKITGATGSTLTLSVGGTGSAITGDADIKYTVTAGTISINGALFTPSGVVPVINPTVPTVPTFASVATQVTTVSVASQPPQVTQATVTSTPSAPSTPDLPKVVEVETKPTLIGNEKVEDVVGKLIVNIEVSLPKANQPLSVTLQDDDPRAVVPLQNQSSSQTSSSSSASAGRSGTDLNAAEYTAQRQISSVNATAIGALIPPTPTAVPGTGAPLVASNTIKVDPADTGGANGQVIARADGAVSGGLVGAVGQAGGTTTILPGLLVQAPRTAPREVEPPLSQQPPTLNDEVFLD